MQLKFFKKVIYFSAIITLSYSNSVQAQLSGVFERIFNTILVDELTLSPGLHAQHFIPAAEIANLNLTPALNSLIASNVSSFPLSSTVAGVTFDFSTGMPVKITESLGPIFAETAQTLGKGKINVGFNYTYLNLSQFRGLDTEEMRFTFTHQDVTPPFGNNLGDSPNESDTIDLFLNLDANANIFAIFATLGVTNNLDIGVAVPLVNVSLTGNARAVINSFTFAKDSSANHNFGPDGSNPELQTNVPYDESATGLGDIAIRLKYSFVRGTGLDLAALVDIRLPTGDEDDFLGTGKANIRWSGIVSKKIGDFTPHLNIGYERRSADLDSDEFEFTAGFDQKVYPGITFAFDIFGEIDLNDDEAIRLFPGTTTIIDRVSTGQSVRKVDLSNIPERDNDNAFNASFGFRVAPSERVIFLGNILVPLNEGGLRSSVASTIGLAISL
jgi:hypothetical protein